MLLASLFGLFVGAVPGLTATMATALLVPVTFFMAPIPAIAAIVTATAMAIFSGDMPGCLLRMPGTPASAAYTDEAYAMTRKGHGRVGARRGAGVLGDRRPVRHRRADRLGAGAGGIRAAVQLVRIFLAGAAGPHLRGRSSPASAAQGVVTLLLGLLVACVGLGNPAGYPRFTFGNAEMTGGIGMIADDDRHVRDLGGDPLRGGHQPAGGTGGREGRQRVRRASGSWPRSTRCRSCAAACWAPPWARCPAPAPTSPRGCRMR